MSDSWDPMYYILPGSSVHGILRIYATPMVSRFHTLSHDVLELQGNQACNQSTVSVNTTCSMMGKKFLEHSKPKKEEDMLENHSICCPNSAPVQPICPVIGN